mgnify:CR=1 FL=1
MSELQHSDRSLAKTEKAIALIHILQGTFDELEREGYTFFQKAKRSTNMAKKDIEEIVAKFHRSLVIKEETADGLVKVNNEAEVLFYRKVNELEAIVDWIILD